MAEKVGQYYFQVEKGEFVNKGEMIEFDNRGRERFSLKQQVLTKSAIAFAVGATFTGAFGLIWQLTSELNPLIHGVVAVSVPSYAGFFVAEILKGLPKLHSLSIR